MESIEVEEEEINFNKFKEFHEKLPIIIYPAFRLQEKMKSRILGKRFWKDLYNRMVEKDMQKNKEQQQENLQQNIEEGRELKFSKNRELFIKIKERKVATDQSNDKGESLKGIFKRKKRRRSIPWIRKWTDNGLAIMWEILCIIGKAQGFSQSYLYNVLLSFSHIVYVWVSLYFNFNTDDTRYDWRRHWFYI